MGILTGGVIFSAVGGYNSSKAFPLIIFICIIANLVSLPLPFLNSKHGVYFMMWMTLFFGAFVLPTMTGIMINSVS